MRGLPVRHKLVKGNLIYRGVPSEYTEAILEHYDNEPKRTFFKRYLTHMDDMYEDKMHLILYGNNGTGKTYLSSILVKEAYRQRYDSCMITLAQLMDITFNSSKNEEYQSKLEYIRRCHFLVIDEVGKEQFTSTGSNKSLLEDTLRRADTIGQVVIICTNMPMEQLYSTYGQSIQSLIHGNYTKLEFNFKDGRMGARAKKKSLGILKGEC